MLCLGRGAEWVSLQPLRSLLVKYSSSIVGFTAVGCASNAHGQNCMYARIGLEDGESFPELYVLQNQRKLDFYYP